MKNIRLMGKEVIVNDYHTIKRHDVSSPEGKSVLREFLILFGGLYAGIGLLVLILLNIVFYLIFFRNPSFENENMLWVLYISIGIPGIFIVLGIIMLAFGLHFKKKNKPLALGEEPPADFCNSSDELHPELVPDRQD